MLIQIIWSCWGWVFIYINPGTKKKEKSWSSRQLSKSNWGCIKSPGFKNFILDRIVWAMYGLTTTYN